MKQSQNWWDNLSPQMQEYLKKQPVWHDRDLIKAAVVGAVIGFILGLTI